MPQESASKTTRSYGVRVPILSFQELIELLETIYRTAGEDSSLDALARIMGNTPSSSTFRMKLHVLRGFGLIARSESGYSFSELAKKIVQPQSAEERSHAIHDAFSQNEYLKAIWEKHKGKILPKPEFLANYILSLSIPNELKASWANYFIEGAKFAGILSERGEGMYQVLSEPLPSSKAEAETKVTEVTPPPLLPPAKTQVTNLGIEGVEGKHWGILNQRSISGGRKAIFAIPDELTQQDIDTLRFLLKSIDTGLDGLKKHETSVE